jgi:hypothetical protein
MSNTILTDLIDGAGQAIRDAADVWLDEEAERDERADARETLSEIEDLRTQIGDLERRDLRDAASPLRPGGSSDLSDHGGVAIPPRIEGRYEHEQRSGSDPRPRRGTALR